MALKIDAKSEGKLTCALYSFKTSLGDCFTKRTDISACHALKFEYKERILTYKKKQYNGSNI